MRARYALGIEAPAGDGRRRVTPALMGEYATRWAARRAARALNRRASFAVPGSRYVVVPLPRRPRC